MKIETAKHSGFCFGVKRAIQIANETAQNNKKTITLGPIIHNPQMVEFLRKKGIHSIDDINDISDETIIIRSHGITAENYKLLLEKDLNIVDATCPFVKKAQEFAQKLTRDGYQLYILGEKNHPEVEALLSYIDDSAVVVTNPDNPFPKPTKGKVALIAQTTQSEEKFERLAKKLISLCEELHVVKTICNATILRQESTRNLAQKVDIMIVIGGKNSANTTRLAEIASAEGCRTFHIETGDELKIAWFENVDNVGITAGASTPNWIINSVKEKIKKINETK
ncbi:MAG: 4-hydroxy-3-methylbut-2-enyl diphosphate reductase [Candidatus Cloacimonetes bacterium]|nr:4-hydroxy-3-methylbut-2-enyl diphosphate reductase [Candidatus Cloacimonadota bacterium]